MRQRWSNPICVHRCITNKRTNYAVFNWFQFSALFRFSLNTHIAGCGECRWTYADICIPDATAPIYGSFLFAQILSSDWMCDSPFCRNPIQFSIFQHVAVSHGAWCESRPHTLGEKIALISNIRQINSSVECMSYRPDIESANDWIAMNVCKMFLSIYTLINRALGIVPHILDFDPSAIEQGPHTATTVATAYRWRVHNHQRRRRWWGQCWRWYRRRSLGAHRRWRWWERWHRQQLHQDRTVVASASFPILETTIICIWLSECHGGVIAKNTDKWQERRQLLYHIYIYYGAKYFVTLIIYAVQFSNDKQLYGMQMESLHIYRKLCRQSMVNWRCQQPARPQFPMGFPFDEDGDDRHRRPATASMNVGNFAKTLATIIAYCIVSYLKLVHIYRQSRTMNAFDLACYYYPNIFICLYATQFSIGIQQQIHIFGKMNNVFQHFIVELNYYGVRRWARSGDSDTAACSTRRNSQRFGRPNGRNPMRIAIVELNALIAMHDALRCINSTLESNASLPIAFIIANAFVNIISEVWNGSGAIKMYNIPLDRIQIWNPSIFRSTILCRMTSLCSRCDAEQLLRYNINIHASNILRYRNGPPFRAVQYFEKQGNSRSK